MNTPTFSRKADQRSTSSRTDKPIRLEALSQYRVAVPPEVAQAGLTLIYRVGVDGRLTAEVVKVPPVGEGIDDIIRLRQARSIVSSIDNTAKRSDKVEESNKVLVALAQTAVALPEEQRGTVKPLPSYHSERITQNVVVNYLKTNLGILNANQFPQEAVRNFLIQQLNSCISGIENYLYSLMTGRKSSLNEHLLKTGALKWAYAKLGSNQISLGINEDPLKLCYPQNANSTIYITPKEMANLPGKKVIPILTNVGRKFLAALPAIQALYGIENNHTTKKAEEYFSLRLYIPRGIEKSNLEKFTSLPPDLSNSSQFADLLSYVSHLFRAAIAINPLDVRPSEFYRWYPIDNFDLDPLSQLRPREQFLEVIKRLTIEQGLNTPFTSETIIGIAGRLSSGETIHEAVNQERDRPFENQLALADYAIAQRVYNLTQAQLDTMYNQHKDAYSAHLIKPPEVTLQSNREAHKMAGPKGVKFLSDLEKHPIGKALAPGVRNYLFSFRRQELGEYAVDIMKAQLAQGSTYLSAMDRINHGLEQDDNEVVEGEELIIN